MSGMDNLWLDAATRESETRATLANLQRLAEPIMEWLALNHDPHTSITIDMTGARLYNEVCGYHTAKYCEIERIPEDLPLFQQKDQP